MTAENFCYWLHGMFEINEVQGFDKHEFSIETVDLIKRHLDLVFNNVTKPKTPDLGYQLIDTRFTGVSTLPLCGQDFPTHPSQGIPWDRDYSPGLYWEPDYYDPAYRGEEPSTICRDNTLKVTRTALNGKLNNETLYC
jgi:hypothetical protein